MNGDDNAIRERAAGYIDRTQTRIGEALSEAAGSADLRQMSVADAAEGLSAQFQGAGVLAVARNDPSVYLRLSKSINALVRAYG
jgi:hypothetical protein